MMTMRKRKARPIIKPERIAGIVALSYLVLIPVGAAIAYKKLRYIDNSLDHVWMELNLPVDENGEIGERRPKLRKILGGIE